MKDYSTEADARIIIDDLLRQAKWDPADKSQVLTEVPVRATAESVAEPTAAYGTSAAIDSRTDYPTRHGRADYVLLNGRGHPLATIEAKRSAIHPYTAKQQALPYAKEIGAPFIFLTNGELIYFWDYTNDDARIINSLYSRKDLERLLYVREERKPLATIMIPEYYIRQGEQRRVRPYQQDAMKALDHAFELSKRRFLIELPTGTGKTDIICLYLKRLFEAHCADRILFLVDREQLAKQAIDAIQDILGQYSSYWFKAGLVRQEKQITVCLLQSMISRYTEFTSGYFDVVIADECHRSIYGAWQIALTYFDAFHLGLTATPAAYIERNTYKFYQCKDGEPDFSLPIQDAFNDEYLIRYKFAKGITLLVAEGADIDEEHYDPEEFERKWTNEDTNRKMMEEFDRLAWENYRELAPGQKTGPGKAVVFAITKRHAARLTEYLNHLHPEHKGRYAQVITSDVANADDLIRKFKYEEYPQVAVSVDMLTTGFDCRELLHLVMCRRIFSPILYQQIRGRGTRTAPHIRKQKFVIYDFFRNHEYFNDSDTDIFTGTGPGQEPGGQTAPPKPPGELKELGIDDEWLEKVTYIEVGPTGERVDKRDYVSNWETIIRSAVENEPVLQKIKNNEPLTEDEEAHLTESLNTPKYFFNEDNLRHAYRKPTGILIDFIKAALGSLKIKSKEEELTENFHAWLVTKSLNPEQAQYLSLLKNRGIVRGKIEIQDLFQPPLSILNAAHLGIELFGEKDLRSVIQEMNEAVFQLKIADR